MVLKRFFGPYNNVSYLDMRRATLQKWVDYLDELREKKEQK